MIILSSAEKALLCLWQQLIRTKGDKTVRPTLLFYLMVEILIDYLNNLPDDVRPQRPSEKALNMIGATSGALSKWRKKWQKIWFVYKKIQP